ncbi:MAG: TonB-dependent receptor plug domain-containing protein, partial [Ginsengibacter sp.]
MKYSINLFFLCKICILVLGIFLFKSETFGQSIATVKGKILDSISDRPLPATTIQLYEFGSKKWIKGSTASDDGNFTVQLTSGHYFSVIEHTGYVSFNTHEFVLSASQPQVNLGTIRLVSSATVLSEVTVQVEKSFMQLELDKRIFTVGKDLANAGGSASDILTNIPSVSVDGEGNVKLRGSDNVRILVDGKPSGLVSFKGSGGLQQLPAGLIDKVEIITNPSARYEAEGNTGIINIILKKDKRQGFNGS